MLSRRYGNLPGDPVVAGAAPPVTRGGHGAFARRYCTVMALARLASPALDCTDPAALAQFCAELIGGEVAFSSDEFCAVKTSNGWLATVRVSDYQAPTWAAAAVPKQMHLDLAVDDLDAAEAEAGRLGART